METAAKKTKECSVIQLIEYINELTLGEKEFINAKSQPYAKELANRLNMTPMHATFLSVIANMCDRNSISLHDMAEHFGVSTLRIVDKIDILADFIGLNLITSSMKDDGNVVYSIPMNVIASLKEGVMPEPVKMEGLDIDDFIALIMDFLDQRKRGQCDDESLQTAIRYVTNENRHLSIARQLDSLKLDDSSLALFFVFAAKYIICHDDNQDKVGIDEYFSMREYLRHTRQLENGEHILMKSRLVEYACQDGQTDLNSWTLSDFARNEVLAELELPVNKSVTKDNLTRHEDITEKQLYYNAEVTRQVSRLESLLDGSRMSAILKEMESHGMRRGFTCLFYGVPGTGKTETVLQLARRSGRDIMMVDVPGIRSKWVGETEQNIKALFDRYRTLVSDSVLAPILLFNEADALLNRRNECGLYAVDKMENAMQNIILQEMENLEGIMIATTNLTGSLDDAFDRRFLYKIEFEKPSPEERKHIWMSMLPDLKEGDALILASKFDFSGGQIENIARKRIVDDILDSRKHIDLKSLVENCEHERIRHRTGSDCRVGFQ